MIVQILFTCINRGEQSHSKPSIISLLSLADILFLVILHLLHLSTDTTPPSPPINLFFTLLCPARRLPTLAPCRWLTRGIGGRWEGRKRERWVFLP